MTICLSHAKTLMLKVFTCLLACTPSLGQQGTGESDFDYGYGASDAPTVIVGAQEWTSKNLNVTHFANGDPIPEAKTPEEWKMAQENKLPVWCFLNNDSKKERSFGKLYNWYAVIDTRGLAPKGWHVPTDSEWKTLSGYLGENAHMVLKSRNGWIINGNNRSGFSALPGGSRAEDGSFKDIGIGSWWSSSEFEKKPSDAILYLLFPDLPVFDRIYAGKHYGSSVRCVKD